MEGVAEHFIDLLLVVGGGDGSLEQIKSRFTTSSGRGSMVEVPFSKRLRLWGTGLCGGHRYNKYIILFTPKNKVVLFDLKINAK